MILPSMILSQVEIEAILRAVWKERAKATAD